MAQSGIKAGSESDGQELDCDEITLKGEDIYNKVNSVLASIQLGKFFNIFWLFLQQSSATTQNLISRLLLRNIVRI